ncbi:MAG: hypothetical protein WD359_09925, partial [Dehalococcoidia bacterium]
AGLDGVEVRCADAALTDSYAGAVPADIVVACGVFGNISDADIQQTVDQLPGLCVPGATVIWTRGGTAEHDIAPDICRWFEARGFERIAFDSSPDEDHFRVGVHRLAGPTKPLQRGERLFTFVRLPLAAAASEAAASQETSDAVDGSGS